MNLFSDAIVPTVVILIIFHGIVKGVNVFETFLCGAKKGFEIIIGIAPSLIALVFCINTLKASGGLNILCSILSPVTSILGIPGELAPLTIISPISGSGSISLVESILKEAGPDSFIGRCASVMMGSTETTFYTMTIYYGSVNIKKTRHTLPCALCADLTSFVLSPIMVNLFLM